MGDLAFVSRPGWLTETPSAPTAWVLILAGLVLAAMVAAIIVFMPKARRWGRANRLHRLASRNGADLRASGLRDLNETLRTLESARGACIASHRDDVAGQLDALVKQVAVVRDRVASDYVPTPPNAPMPRREFDLVRPDASASLLVSCVQVARAVRDGGIVPRAALGAAQVALRVVDQDLAPI